MSGLSLYGDFFKAASLAQSGAVRLAPGSDDKLVNTGTLGGRTVSVARNDPDKAGSRQKTIDAFKGALAERFGDDAAAAALKDLGLDKQGARLTGRLVFDAAKGASAHANAARGAVMAANVAANEAALQRFLPPDPPAPVSTVVPPPPRGAPPPLPPRPGQ
jgi:hypothetical protein